MSISAWMMALFAVGVVALGLCLLFLKGCERI